MSGDNPVTRPLLPAVAKAHNQLLYLPPQTLAGHRPAVCAQPRGPAVHTMILRCSCSIRCLQECLPSPQPGPLPLPASPTGKPRICMAISTFNSPSPSTPSSCPDDPHRHSRSNSFSFDWWLDDWITKAYQAINRKVVLQDVEVILHIEVTR